MREIARTDPTHARPPLDEKNASREVTVLTATPGRPRSSTGRRASLRAPHPVDIRSRFPPCEETAYDLRLRVVVAFRPRRQPHVPTGRAFEAAPALRGSGCRPVAGRAAGGRGRGFRAPAGSQASEAGG